MFRRWLIRGSIIGLLLLLLAGWGVSTGQYALCRYCHGGNVVSCEVIHGRVSLWWGRGPVLSAEPLLAPDPEWYTTCRPWPFAVADTPFFWQFHSTAIPGYNERVVTVAGFGNEHRVSSVSGLAVVGDGVTIPFWFLIVVTGAGLVWAWRKTRPRINPATAFPVELGDTRQ